MTYFYKKCFCFNYGLSKKNWYKDNYNKYILANYPLVDSTIAWTYIDLTAIALWYNTIWMSYYENITWRKIMNIPNDLKLLYYIALWKNKFPNKVKKNRFF